VSTVRSSLAAVLCMMAVAACGNREAVISESHDDRADKVLAQIPSPPWPTAKVPVEDNSRGKPLQLDEAARHVLARQALAGDEGSAFKLSLYYALMSPPDLVERQRWLTIAAENGNLYAMGSLASLLEKSGGDQNCLRAKYWQERALRVEMAAHGDAQTQFANLLGLAQTWQRCVARGESQR
jgi:hypothetical protein